ncbi:non-ribosomal peptide synthetase, partial [Chondromyces apiculatus]|uniref:non-ribosomal peptide synthetase n=1 Tax=Chondromyces apiculatus TaxID=51 RepID=UPI0007C43485
MTSIANTAPPRPEEAPQGRDETAAVGAGTRPAAPEAQRTSLERAILDSGVMALSAAQVGSSGDASSRWAQGATTMQVDAVPWNTRIPGRVLASSGQFGLWLLDRIGSNRALYNIHFSIHMEGPVDASLLQQSITAIVARHEVLRTTFHDVEGDFFGLVMPPGDVALPLVDLRAINPDAQGAQVSRLSAEHGAAAFDLTHGPLARMTLVTLKDDEHVLLLTQHHTVTDGWSLGILVVDLFVHYRALREGRAPRLSEQAITYGDHVARQQAPAQVRRLAALTSWWQRRLSALPELELPFRRSIASPTYAGDSVAFAFSPALVSALESLAAQHGCTLFRALLTAWAALLHRYTGQTDFPIGTVTAMRRDPELHQLVGFLANTLVLRCDVDPAQTFVALLRRMRAVLQEALEHADAPFDDVVRAVGASRQGRLNPLIQAALVLANYSFPDLQAGAERWTPTFDKIDAGVLGVTKFEISVTLRVRPEGGIDGTLDYATDLFDRPAMERMVGHFEALIAEVVTDPCKPLSDLSLLTDVERRHVLVDWNDTARDFRREACAHELVMDQASRTPDALAVLVDDEALTYRDLDARSSQLAHHLRALGVGPEVLVGLCVERSIDMVVGLLGILKAGGAYVPLDPTYPEERLSFMLADARAGVLLTQAHLAARLRGSPARLVCLDADAAAIAAWPRTAPPTHATPENLAYVIYTSGSTGKPKGAMSTHRGLVNLVAHETELLDIRPGTPVLQFASIAFDASVSQIFGALSRGAQLVLASPEQRRSSAALMALLQAREVEVAHLPPSALSLLDPEALPALRVLMVGGEACPVAAALQCAPGRRFINSYGPTEATVTASYWEGKLSPDTAVPIGRPSANNRLHVLSPALHLLPVGVRGELFIAGIGVSRGYLDRPALTAERFLPDPHGPPGSRMYRTGDLCRWLEDGDVDFLGRLDHQVKIRGFRIELGEIEAVLGQHPAVRSCVVVAREDVPGNKRLVAYLVPATEPVATTALREHLKAKLPDYMVPAAFVVLEALPLNANGKIDHKALPLPEERPEEERSFVAPRTPVEEIVAVVWAALLGVARVGAQDDFFALGGHSLLATRLHARLRATFGVELPLRVLFEATTVAALAAEIDAAQRGGQLLDDAPLVRVSRDATLPLSFAQERLWFLDRLEPDSPFYNIPTAMRLSGPLDVDAFARSLRGLVRRHEALRTTFPTRDGQPHQAVAPESTWSLLVQEVQASDVPRLVDEEARRPFDLARGPLFRATLLRVSEREHVLLATMHHIISDGWSMGVFMRELGALYEAFATGQPSPFAELPIQYVDHTVWQRRVLTEARLDEQLSYWHGKLTGAPALSLPTDYPRPPVASHRGSSLAFQLPRDLADGLRALSRKEGATLFMTLLSAFAVVLGRHANQADFCVGTPVAGRSREEAEGLIGCFLNTLVVRADLSGEPTFRALLARTRDAALGAYAHQDVPFERLVERLGVARSLGHSPLFQVMFVLQNAATDTPRLPGLVVSTEEGTTGTAKFDLTLSMQERPEGLFGVLEYATDLFEAATITRLAAHLEVLLRAVVEDPGATISTLPLLTDAERHRLLLEWNDPAASYPSDRSLPELFREQATRTPEAIALRCGDEQLTYRELDARSNQLGHHLRALGVGADVLVGLCVERSVEMMVGLLGILKAGGAYLPLDPSYPRERLAFMVEDTQVPVVLTQARVAQVLPGSDARLVRLDADWEEIAKQPATPPAHEAKPGDLAYVIYTSGSTGTPKGAMVEHRQVVRLFTATAAWFRFDARDVWTMFHSYAFDFSVWELWGALLHGGRVVIVPHDVSRDPEAFHALLRAEKVTILNQTPSAFRELMRADAAASPEARAALSLRQVIFGGEALDIGELRPWWERHGDETPLLVNMYGITETTVHVTYRPLRKADLARPWSSVIGRPIPDLQVHVLDPSRKLVPIGVSGEMYVGGAGVSRGYLGRSALTAERFVESPLDSRQGARLYRTGDLARWNEHGELEYLGRIDHQVKIRGFRIELGEIESVLGLHPSVRTCVVVAREDVPGDKRLVAYVVPVESGASASAYREHLRAKLPDYMIPAAFVVLDALPLTPSGKVDRKALPAPDGRLEDALAFVAPRTPVEEILAGIWALLLGLDRVGVQDNFFELGGHSLLATQVSARLRTVLGVELPLRVLFEAPTVAGLAAQVEAAQRAGAVQEDLPLVPVPRSAPLPLSFAQERLWFLDRLEPNSPFYNISLIVRLSGPLVVGALARGLRALGQRHESLRTTFPSLEGQPYQAITEEPRWSLVTVDTPPSDVQRRSEEEARTPFNLAEGPLFRATLLRSSDQEHALLLTMHHIVSDGWSMGVLVRELGGLYEAFSAGQPSPLSELPIQYADHAVWQRRKLQGETQDAHLAYWQATLTGAPSLSLPTDRPRPPVVSHRGSTLTFQLPRDLGDDLRALSRKEGATLFMTLLSAFAVLLGRHANQSDFCIGTPVAGRSREEVEGLLGFFINTLVLRADLSGEPTFRALLSRTREAALGAYAHQDVPFEQIADKLGVARSLGHSPLFQVMFVLQNAPTDALRLPGLVVSTEEVTTGTAKFDLTLAMQERSEGLFGVFEYATDLFDAETIARLAGHLGVLLRAVVQDPDAPISTLPLLTDAERHRLLVEWNDTVAEYPSGKRIEALFMEQASRTPEATAVSCGDEQLTYGALDARSSQLAHHLRALGVRAGVLVGICVERSIDMVVGLLGILKAGGAYVPLDPSYPRERLAFMVEDTQVRVVLTRSQVAHVLAGTDATIVRLDADREEIAKQPATLPAHGATASDLAYVIYTSGSTGKPKGVSLSHQGLVNLCTWHARAYGIAEGERTTQVAAPGFDASVWEIWPTLVAGGSLLIVDEATRLSPEALARFLVAQNVAVAFLPTPLAEAALSVSWPKSVNLRALLTGGDALRRRPPADLPFALVNHYGPTECTVVATAGLVTPAGHDVPPIGKPIANTRVYVLDARRAPVPIGVPGELYLGGSGLAHGYLNRPELTEARFVPDPFSAAPSRLYRTGDLVRWLPDGNLEFLGRVDHQVKLRGFRIELGEIEAVLGLHPAVSACAVVAREDVPGNKRLVAYVVPRGEGTSPEVLRVHLAATLPEYMVPSAFVVLEALPLSPNGKLDRRALPLPEPHADDASSFVPPRAGAEEMVAEIWSGLLGIGRVGAQDDFFALGGHSLLATQVISRLRATFGVELPLRALFEAPTVAGLAARLDAAGSSRLTLTRAERPDLLPLSFAQRRLWFLQTMDGPSATYHIPLALHLRGELDVSALAAALADVVGRHESLRTVFPVVDEVPYQRVLDLAAAHPRLAVTATSAAALPALLTEATRRGFDLSVEPPLRAEVFALGPDEHVLFLLLHHIAGDGWSMGPLLDDLATAYQARRELRAPGWAPLPVQYADYTLWQLRLLGDQRDPSSLFATQIAYWARALAGVPEQLPLPTDRPRPLVPSTRGGTVPIRLGPALHRGLFELARQRGASLFMVLQAGLSALLSRLGAGEDIVLGSPIAGRTDHALDDLVGFFVNTLVLRTDTSGDPSFTQLLGRARETALGAYAHQDVPFELLVEVLNPVRSLAHHPLFQVMLVLQNNPEAHLDLPGIAASTVPVALETAKFDLLFALGERRGTDGSREGIEGVLEYASDLFDPATVEAMVARWLRLLEAAVADPELPLSRIDLLTTEERQALLRDHNDTSRALPEVSLPALFEAQALALPEGTAVVFDDAALTYAEIDARANRLAHALIARGAGPERRVALLLPRTPDLIVALLATLKAGAAYVPVDPDYPATRIAAMLEDARPTVLLTSRATETAIPHDVAAPRLVVDDPATAAALERFPTTSPTDAERTALLMPQHPAYVIYTSGSTGIPKGVVMSCGALVNLLFWHQSALPSGAGTRVAQFTALSFDVSAQEILSTLCFGKTLVVPPDSVRRSAEHLARWLTEHEVEELFAPNLVVEALAEAAMEQGLTLPALRDIAQAGEALTLSRQVRELYRVQPGRRLHNHYGPTETHVATGCTLPADLAACALPVTIGKPIHNTQVYVLDGRLNLAPAGVAGELYIAGACLARGYLDRPGLTAQRFVADPFGPPGARMYRTGDHARWRKNGALEFLGRLDTQVKIRGFRIELGEIEAALTAHPELSQAAVVAREHHAGGKWLVAYAVPFTHCTPRPEALRDHLRQRLPEYMVPAAVVVLERLPLTPNGKLDRHALPAPDLGLEGAKRGPRTPQEQILCDLFAEVLALPEVGIDEDFFALGGHSLLATRLMGRIRATFGAELPLRSLFEAPTVARLAPQLDGAEEARLSLTVQPRPERLPLSFAQRRLWFLHQMEGRTATYNLALALRLTGALDRKALEAALGDVVARHESLRTVFPEVEGTPHQVILDAASARPTLSVTHVDEPGLSEALASAVRHGFDLSTEPPLRAALFALAPDVHVLFVLMHHIVGDGWSMGPLTRDLAAAYTARSRGEPPAWSPLPVQYADYTLWQRTLLGEQGDAGSLFTRQLAYWTQALAGLPEQIELPTDRPRPKVASHRGGAVAAQWDARLHQGLATLARQGGASLFMVLQAGLAALLSRLGAGHDIALGSPIAGRTDHALEGLVGFFVNTLVLRTDTSGNPTFRQLLARAREAALSAYAHQDVPFEVLVEALNPARSLAHHPLFQVMLGVQNAPQSEVVIPGLRVEAVETGSTASARVDLTISLSERRGEHGALLGIEGAVEYSSDLFDPATVETMMARWARLLEAAVANPDQPIGDIGLMTAEERHELLVARNDTAQPVDVVSFPALFEAQVEATPGAMALVFEDQELTYAELNARANRLAHGLLTEGVRPEDIVALALPRSPELVIAILAVLKAGAAYLPVDPEYPAARIAFMLTDARPALLLTSRETPAAALAGLSIPRLVVDGAATRAMLAEQPGRNPDAVALPQHPAYVIYTSGSTGTPKGVVVSHAGIASLATTHVTRFGVGPGSRVLQFASPSFDASFWDLCMGLLSGAALVLAPKEQLLPGAALAALTARQQVTHATLPPAALAVMSPRDGLPPGMTLIVAGEACAPDLVATWAAGRRMVNAYGPTETTVCATLSEPLPPVPHAPPIGRPIVNAQVYVLDAGLQPVPPGVVGELYVSGAGLARGYLGRPGLTSERFLASPFGSGERMYRTGDRARWTAGGDLEFCGRVDAQVKVRGYRIELGEIEAALTAHPEIAHTAVILREDRPGEKRLIAYAVAAAGAAPEPRALRDWLTGRLPDHMVPAALVMLDALPLTRNGKLDRQALPAPDLGLLSAGRAPRTPREQLLCDLFAETLDLPSVSIDDDFFELGGHSLLATQLVSRVRVTFGVELSVRRLFEAPSVARLAEHLDRSDAEHVRLPLRVQARPDDLPLSFAQRRLWFLHQMEGHTATYNIPMALRLSGTLDRAALEAALGDVVARHESLRTVFSQIDNTPCQLILAPGEARLSLPVTLTTEADLPEALGAAAQYGFDLSSELPLRVALFALAPTEHVLLLLLHHIAGDGASLAPLSRDIATAYRARRGGEAPAWAPLPVQYADYTLWQRALLGDETDPASLFSRQLLYWTRTLADLPEQIELPADRARPPVASFRGDFLPVTLDAGLHRGLSQLARQGSASLFMVLQAGLAALLSRLGAGSDIPLGTPIAGRMDRALEDLVGFFVNTLVLRTDTSGDPTFRQLLGRVREAALSAYAHQDMPFEHLVEVLNPARSLAHHPLFQVLLAVQNVPAGAFDLPGLQVSVVPTRTGTSKFDLGFSLSELRGADGSPQGLGGYLEYATDRFDLGTIEALFARWVRLLEAAVANPDQPISSIALLTAEERHELLVARNATAQPVVATPFPVLFEAQVEAASGAVALVFEDQGLTYAELNARANRLAHVLRARGVGPEQIVALALPRSPELVVAIVAVLKAGAAYLPVDPEYPAARIAFMLTDARPTLLLTSHETPAAALAGNATPRLVVDDVATRAALVEQPDRNPDAVVLPQHPAYVIYTSGSTGTPKGVVVSHAGIASLAKAHIERFGVNATSRVLQFASPSFDAAFADLAMSLLSGAALVLA